MQRRTLVSVVASAWLGACGAGGESFVSGEVPSELRTLDPSGSGSASGVQAVSVGGGGEARVIGSASLAADGSYLLTVPAGEEAVVIRAVDEAGVALAATMLAVTPTRGDTTECGPMSEETSIEAEVWLEASAEAESDPVDVMQRIDARLAEAVAASADLGQALGDVTFAVLAAQSAELQALAEVGLTTSQGALFEAEQEASLAWTAAVASGTSPEAADAELDAAVATILEGMGADDAGRSRVETTVSAAIRASADAVVDDGDVHDALVGAGASAEARASAEASVSILADAGADSVLLAAVEAAGAALEVAVSLGADASDIDAAWGAYEASLVGATDLEAEVSLLALLIGGATLFGDDLSALLDVRADARADLALALAGAADRADSGAEAVAEAAVEAQAAFAAAVRAGAEDLTELQGAELDAAVALSVEATAHAAGG